jgi:hypothetical protein
MSAPCPSCFSPAEDPIPNAQEAGWASRLVCMAVKTLLPLEFNTWTTQPVAGCYIAILKQLNTTERSIINSLEDVLLNEEVKYSYYLRPLDISELTIKNYIVS